MERLSKLEFYSIDGKKITKEENPSEFEKDIKKTIEELYKKIEENPEDYRAIYDLAKCEEEIGKIELALEKYELLANNGILEKREELNICKKLESKYSELGKKEEAFKYAIKIIKIEPSNNLYIIKVANTLAKEGNFKLSNHYFGKAIVSKTEFMTEDLKCAAFVSYKMKDYKKCIAFLEELRKRLIKEAIANKSKEIKKDILELEKDLISTYILSEELNIAKSFIEDILSNKFIDKNHEFDINKLYLFVLYKLEESERFKSLYNKLYSLYKINESNKNYAHLKFDYSFYSFFITSGKPHTICTISRKQSTICNGFSYTYQFFRYQARQHVTCRLPLCPLPRGRAWTESHRASVPASRPQSY